MARNLVTPKGKAAVAVGLGDLQKRILDVINVAVSKNSVKGVWMKGALLIRDEARRRAPELTKDTPRRVRGLLKKAIFAAYGADDKPNVLVGVNYRIAPHAWITEFGTTYRETKSGAARGNSPPHPYMRPALTSQRSKAVEVMAQGYRELIETAAAK